MVHKGPPIWCVKWVLILSHWNYVILFGDYLQEAVIPIKAYLLNHFLALVSSFPPIGSPVLLGTFAA